MNELSGPPSIERIDDGLDGSVSWVDRATYKDTSGLVVVGITVYGGGHTAPGGCQYEPIFSVGRTNRDIIAADEVWAFFARHTR